MTRQELNDAVAAYLDQHDESYDDVINSLSKVIKNYYDELERKAIEEKKRKKEIADYRMRLAEAILSYVEVLLEEELEDEEYDKNWGSLCQSLENEVEPAILKLKKISDSIEFKNSDKDLLMNYVKGLI